MSYLDLVSPRTQGVTVGLFINSHLQSLSTHKRLTELEKLSEISTGILALKAMVEGGGNLDNHQLALENLMRMLPMLSATQQKFVMEEIFTPLMAQQEPSGLTEHIAEGEAVVEASENQDNLESLIQEAKQLMDKDDNADLNVNQFRDRPPRTTEENFKYWEQQYDKGLRKANFLKKKSQVGNSGFEASPNLS